MIVMSNIQYITDDQGSQIGVILNMEDYHNLIAKPQADPEILTDLNFSELQALADSRLAPSAQERLDTLLASNNADTLTDAEALELDQLLEQIDQLSILKTRARYTLHQLVVQA
jgi:hypothetical protein